MAKRVLITAIITFISLYLTTSNGLKYQRCIQSTCKDWSDKLKNPANTSLATPTISEGKIHRDKNRPYRAFSVLATPVINETPGKIDKNRPRFAFKKTPLNKSDKSESQKEILQNRPRLASTEIFPDKQNQNENSVNMLNKISNPHFLDTSKFCDIWLTATGIFLFDVLRYSCNEIQRMQMMAMRANKEELQNNRVKNNEWEYGLTGETRKFFCTPDYCYRIQENGKKNFYTCNHEFCAPVKQAHLQNIKIAKMNTARQVHHPGIHFPQAIKQPE